MVGSVKRAFIFD
jgi:hypothetical protein